MKKKLLPITLLAMLGLVACGPTAPSEVPPTSETPTTTVPEEIVTITISNKEALKEPWKAFGASRSVDIKFSKELNATAEIANGNLVITSSDTHVIAVTGKILTPTGAGKATITATYKGKSSDKVEITVAAPDKEPEYKVSTVKQLVEGTDKKGTNAYYVKYKVASLGKKASEPEEKMGDYGNLWAKDVDAAADVKPFQIYGSSATVSGLEYDFGKKVYSFNNPKDAASNSFTKNIKAGDILDTVTIRKDYNTTVEGMSIIRGVNGVVIPNLKTDVATVAEMKDFEIQHSYASLISGSIASIEDAAKGAFTLKNPLGNETIKVTGATANNKSLVIGEDGKVAFTNPSDFNTNEKTKELKVGDAVTMAVVITRNGTTNEVAGYTLDLKPGLKFTSQSVKVGVGKTNSAKAILENAEGEILYEVADTTIAELAINKYSGQVKGIKVGKTKIKATCGNLTAETEIEVYNAKAEPEVTVKTIKEVKEAAYDGTAKEAYKINVTVKDFGGGKSKFGGMTVTDATGETLTVYGSSAKASALSWNDYDGKYFFKNAQDFVSNALTKNIKASDVLTMIVIRADYNGAIQVNGIVKEVFPTEVEVSVPTVEGFNTKAYYDLSEVNGTYPCFLDGVITDTFKNSVEGGIGFSKVEVTSAKGVEKAQLGQGPKCGGVKVNSKFEASKPNDAYYGEITFTIAEGKSLDRIDLYIRAWENSKGEPEKCIMVINGVEQEFTGKSGEAVVVSVTETDMTSLTLSVKPFGTNKNGRFIITSVLGLEAK